MTNISVHQAGFADLDVASVLFDQYRQFQGQLSDVHAAREFLTERFDHGESIVFVARLDSKPVGFAQIYPIFSSVSLRRVFILNDLYVDEATRGSGVGRALLSAVETLAWSLGCSRITLNTTRVNESAQRVYEGSGWEKDNVFFMYNRFPSGPQPAVGHESTTGES